MQRTGHTSQHLQLPQSSVVPPNAFLASKLCCLQAQAELGTAAGC